MPDDRNPVFTIRAVFALQLPAQAGSVEVSPTEMALKFVLVFVGVGVYCSGCRWRHMTSHWIHRPAINVDSYITEVSFKTVVGKSENGWRDGKNEQ
ncbi:hypothetical protein SAMN05444745_103131 [Arthrobacter sp. OV608]|nr:hypothetical protein SAMN05444745_103131 [Arthrobacter sp. OV608]